MKDKLLILAVAGLFLVGTAHATTVTLTTTADWTLGTASSTNYNAPPATGDGHVRLNDGITTNFDHIWVALSNRGTAVRIDTNYNEPDKVVSLADSASGATAILGEYRTAPAGMGVNPSRTTVDANGNVWVGNRNESGFVGGVRMGSVVKLSASPTGTTSTGVWNGTTFDALAWTNTAGADTNGGTSTAADTANLLYVRTAGTANRTIAVDAQNDVWVGGYSNKTHQQLDGTTGATLTPPVTLTPAQGSGGYGGLIDGNGILWSSGWSSNKIARIDTATNIVLPAVTTGGSSYGLGIDTNGFIWNTHLNNVVSKIAPDGSSFVNYNTTGNGGRGVAVTPADNDVWVANSSSSSVTRLSNSGVIKATISVGSMPTGVSVDSNGKVWVTNYSSNSVMRIDPATNLVDLTIELGAGANPYNYSDMTGTVISGTTNPNGSWSFVKDSTNAGQLWDQIFWNTEGEGFIPGDGSIVIEVRAADSLAALSAGAWASKLSTDSLGLNGRFMEVRATLTRGASGVTPVLSDLTFTFSTPLGVIPEPITMLAVGLGIAGLGGYIRRRRTA